MASQKKAPISEGLVGVSPYRPPVD